MKAMKKIISIALFALAMNTGWAQSAYVLPSPTAADEPLTLYIDVAQAGGGLKTMLTNHPEEVDNVYLWTWNPAGPVGGNGEWGSSRDAMKMTWEGGLLFSMTFTPTTYYNVDGPTFFSKGISCLAKLKSGYAHAEDNVGEAKTPDLIIPITPKLCDRLYCTFPELAKEDDFVSITYDNTKETNPALQNMGDDDCYVYLYAGYDIFSGVEYVAPSAVTSTPALKMKRIANRPGLFRLTILAKDFFTGIPEGQTIDMLQFYVLRPGFSYSGVPPFQSYAFLSCE
jgi:hypothetical protein